MPQLRSVNEEVKILFFGKEKKPEVQWGKLRHGALLIV